MSRARTITLAVFAGVGLIGIVLMWKNLSGPDTSPASQASPRSSTAGASEPSALGKSGPTASGSVTGVVRADTGPVAGATVSIRPVQARDPLAPDMLRSVITNPQGAYRFDELGPGAYALSAAATGYAPAYRAPLQVAGATLDGVDLVLDRSGVALRGKVHDSGGGAIAGAAVTASWLIGGASDPERGRTFLMTTDGDGRYDLRLPPGRYQLAATADGYTRDDALIALAVDSQHDFRLDTAGQIAGRVVVRTTREPAGEAEVWMTGTRAPFTRLRSRSAGDGAFSFRNVAPGVYAISAQKRGLVALRSQSVTVSVASSVVGIEVALEPGIQVSGRVTSSGGAPVAGLEVTATSIGMLPILPPSRTSTDKDGSYAVAGLFPGEYRISLKGGGFGPESRDLTLTGDVAGVNFVLSSASAVAGQVLRRSGAPAVAAQVNVWTSERENGSPVQSSGSAITDERGEFRVDGLHHGFAWADAMSVEGTASTGPARLEPGLTRKVTLRIGDGSTISGHVSWAEGAAAVGVAVRCYGPSTTRISTTDRAGAFRCEAVSPGRNTVTATRRIGDQTFNFTQGDRREVEVASGQHVSGIDLSLSRDDETISGMVVRPDGTPADGVVVRASRELGGVSVRVFNEYAFDAKAVSFVDGTFTLTGLPSGTFTVWGECPGCGEGWTGNVPAGAKNVRLQLRDGASVEGIAVDAAGRPIPHYSVFAFAAAMAGESYEASVERRMWRPAARQVVHDAGGAFALRDLKAGTYSLVVQTFDGKGGRSDGLTLRDQDHKTGIRIVVGESVRLRSRVVDHETGAPLAGVRITGRTAQNNVTGTTSADGAFTLEGLVPGTTLPIDVSAADGLHMNDHYVVDVPDGKPEVNLPDVRLIQGKWGTRGPMVRFGWSVDGRLVASGGVGGSVVVAVQPGGMAAEQRVLPGSLLLKAEGKDLTFLGPTATAYLTAGQPGSSLTMTLRLPSGESREYKFTRLAIGQM
jgi:hypothetical protein